MKKLILLGTAESVFNPDYDNMDYEIWGCGSCAGAAHDDIKRIDAIFEIHDPALLVRIFDTKAYDYSRIPNTKVYVQDAENPTIKQLIPNNELITFPLQDLLKYAGVEWFDSTFAYMFVYAAMLGYKDITFHKILLNAAQEYFLERPALEYWITKLMHKEKITVHFPEDCDLFFGNVLYGYKQRPNIYKMMSWRKHLWNQLHIAFHNVEMLTARINKFMGAVDMYARMKSGQSEEQIVKEITEGKTNLEINMKTAKEQKEKYLQYFGAIQNEYWNEDRGG